MPLPHTPEEQAAEVALDEKLGAFYEKEAAVAQPDTSVEEAEPEEEEVEVEEEIEEEAETPRDDKGRFASKDPDIEGYLAKYGGDVDKALKAAVEASSLIGRQGSELGDLRKQFEQFQTAQQQAQSRPHLDQSAFAQLIEDDPAQATAIAYQTGDAAATSTALRVWKEEDPFSASQWVTAQQIAELRNDYDQRLQTATAPLQQRAAGQVIEEALTAFAQEHSDLDQYLGTMYEIAPESPLVLEILKKQDDPKAIKEVYDYLYHKARGRTSETLAAAVADTAAKSKSEAEAAKQQAAVASATSSTETKKQSSQEAWHSQFSEFLQDDSTSINSGLTNG